MSYFSEKTLNHLRLQQGLSSPHRQRSLDITLACKLTLTYGKYHLMMDYRRLAMCKHQMTYQEAERQAEMMNQITIVHHSAADFLDTPDDRVNESIDTFKEYKRLLEEYSDEEMFATLSQTLTWSHFLELVTIEDNNKRLFYQQMGIAEHWSVRQLRDKQDEQAYIHFFKKG